MVRLMIGVIRPLVFRLCTALRTGCIDSILLPNTVRRPANEKDRRCATDRDEHRCCEHAQRRFAAGDADRMTRALLAAVLCHTLAALIQPTNRDDRERGRGGTGHGGGSVGGFGRGGGRGGPGGADPDEMRRRIQAMRDILDAPERLTIAQTDSLVIITTGDGRTTRLSPDGKKIKDESTGFERKTRRDNGHLVSEITGGQSKIVETYAVDAEHHRLTVTLQIDNPRMPNGGVVHRVYDAEGTP
jgi:hypothetical protein